MATTPQFLAAIEGFDIYPAGVLTNNWPWSSVDSTVAPTITASAGAFGGNALSIAAGANTYGVDYNFPGTGQPKSVGGNHGVFTFSGWVNIGTPIAQSTQALVGLGTSASPGDSGAAFTILGVSNSTSGLALLFPSVFNVITTAPISFAISANTYYWVTITIAYGPAGVFPTAIYTINGNTIFSGTLGYTAEVFAAGNVANIVKLARSAIGSWLLDDMVVQSVSEVDAGWPGNPGLTSYTPQFQPRRVYDAVAVGNGPTVQMIPSVAVPNYQAATDPTGVEFVTATDVAQIDLYHWTATGASDVKGVIYKGTSNRWGNVAPQQSVAGVQMPLGKLKSGASRFIAISESDGTNPWTAASITAAYFGQESQ